MSDEGEKRIEEMERIGRKCVESINQYSAYLKDPENNDMPRMPSNPYFERLELQHRVDELERRNRNAMYDDLQGILLSRMIEIRSRIK